MIPHKFEYQKNPGQAGQSARTLEERQSFYSVGTYMSII